MKVIHTSDLHLGHQLYGYDRMDEHLHFFSQLKKIIIDEKPDALLISGDIFDISSPSSAVMKMFKDNILELHELWKDMTIVVTAGNHDSASRIDVDRKLWKTGGVFVFGGVEKREGKFDFSDHVVRVGDKGFVLAVPFVNRAFMGSRDSEEGPEADFFRQAEEMMCKCNDEGLPTVIMAHLAIADCDTEGHKNTVVGGFDTVPHTVFGNSFDYVALGHIHKPQTLGAGLISYSGSPVAVSFDENYTHSVSVVTVEKGSLPDIRRINIEPLRALKTFPEEATDFKKALKKLAKLPDEDNSYIRLNVYQKEDLPFGCEETVTSVVADKKCRYCTIKFEKKTDLKEEKEMCPISAAEFKEATPCDIARRYFFSAGVDEDTVNEYVGMIEKIENEIRENDSL